MHKTYLNEVEVQLIKGADEIVKKIGGFPSIENGCLSSVSIRNADRKPYDVEMVFDLQGWINTLDFHYSHGYKGDKNYYHNDFDERHIRITFHNCYGFETESGFVTFRGGDLYFGGVEEHDPKNRKRDRLPGHGTVIERPYCCFYTGHDEFSIYFNEEECEISAELF